MKKYFEGIGEIEFIKLTPDRIEEASNLIYETYQHEKIWLTYSKEETLEELQAAFHNLVYTPTYIIALLDNKIIGIASYLWSHMSSYVFELSFGTVHPNYQRKGLGQYLTYLRIKEIIEKQENAILCTTARRPQLFEKFGFKTICTFPNEEVVSSYMYCKAEDIILSLSFPLDNNNS